MGLLRDQRPETELATSASSLARRSARARSKQSVPQYGCQNGFCRQRSLRRLSSRTAREGFHRTGMARSMAPVHSTREPPDGSFEHRPSVPPLRSLPHGREDVASRIPDQGRSGGGAAAGHSVMYVTGSGRHALTYVVNADGFLVESPITWYASRQAWGMSPGYDRPNHQGFQREVGETCLVCHAGQVQTIDRSLHRVRITEGSIGCDAAMVQVLCILKGIRSVARNRVNHRRRGSHNRQSGTLLRPGGGRLSAMPFADRGDRAASGKAGGGLSTWIAAAVYSP